MKLQIYIIAPCVVLAIHVEAMSSGILMVSMQKLQDTLNAQNVISNCIPVSWRITPVCFILVKFVENNIIQLKVWPII